MFLVFVFDGLRPDLVRPDWMPHLCDLRARGTWWERSRCVFPPVTRVNAASLATGSYPSTHGLPANTLYLPDQHAKEPLRTTGDVAVLRGLRTAPETGLLQAPTLGEVLAGAGHRTVAVGTGSPGSAYLLHSERDRAGGAVFHHTFAEPPELAATVEQRLGPAPIAEAATGYTLDGLVARVRYGARSLAEVIVPQQRPSLALFWCTVPDALHHRFGIGSREALAGLRSVDEIFGSLLTELERIDGASPNVIVTSDHGFSTVEEVVDVGSLFVPLSRKLRAKPVVAVDGGAIHCYLDNKDAKGNRIDSSGETLDDLAETVSWLAEREWTSALFARLPLPGALPLEAVMLDTIRAADVVACLAWRAGANANGFQGLSVGGGGIAVGAGDHGGGSPFELHNTLLAAGPAFRAGCSSLPAGIVDVAPTVCRVLGVGRPAGWDGRVLDEALGGAASASAESDDLEAEATSFGVYTVAAVERTMATRCVASAGRMR